jgi:hypothetical protein
LKTTGIMYYIAYTICCTSFTSNRLLVTKELWIDGYNKPDKVKRNTVVGKLGNGGLKTIDIQSYFKSLKA